MIIVQVTKEAGVSGRVSGRGVVLSLPWEGVAQETESRSAPSCKYDIIVFGISVEVPEHQFSSAVYEGGGQLAAGTPAVGVGIQLAAKVSHMI